MSATNGLTGDRDLFHLSKENMRPKKRLQSANLRTEDIQGAF